MLAIFLIVFRETFEAALIIGVVAAATRGLSARNRWLTTGICAGLAGSVGIALLTEPIAAYAQGIGQELFNACILMLAAAMLAWHNIWMARHGMVLAAEARQLGQSVSSGQRTLAALAVVVCLAIVREGSETVLFLYGTLAGTPESVPHILTGTGLGLACGGLAGYGLYAGILRIPPRRIFAATSALILLLCATMASQAAGFLVQADLLPSLASPLWNTSAILDDASAGARVLHALIGYEASPSGIQVAFYSATLLLVLTLMQRAGRKT